MANNKLAIIGGSGLYDVEEFTDRKLIQLNTLIQIRKLFSYVRKERK